MHHYFSLPVCSTEIKRDRTNKDCNEIFIIEADAKTDILSNFLRKRRLKYKYYK